MERPSSDKVGIMLEYFYEKIKNSLQRSRKKSVKARSEILSLQKKRKFSKKSKNNLHEIESML